MLHASNAWHSGRRIDSIRHIELHLSSLLRMRAFNIALKDYHAWKKTVQLSLSHAVVQITCSFFSLVIQQKTENKTLAMHMLFKRTNYNVLFFLSCVNGEKETKKNWKREKKNSTIRYDKIRSINACASSCKPTRRARANNKRRYDIKVKYRVDYRRSQAAAFGQCKRWKRRKLYAGVPLWLLVFF